MKNINTIKVNFKGGIISPNDLYNILLAVGKSGLLYVRFGLRQQLLFDVEIDAHFGGCQIQAVDTPPILYNVDQAFKNIVTPRPRCNFDFTYFKSTIAKRAKVFKPVVGERFGR